MIIERNVNRVQVLTWTPVCIVERKECETKRKKTDESKHCEQERTREEREEEKKLSRFLDFCGWVGLVPKGTSAVM